MISYYNTNIVLIKTEDLIEFKNKLKTFELETSQLNLQSQLERYETQMNSLTSLLNQNQSAAMSKVKLEILNKDRDELNNSLNLM
jgi:5-methylcytosine-specific restriction endonuclease McrBC GTP-binding regulatory subunit McrB